MSTTNLTGSYTNGVYQISAVNSVSSDGGAFSESILLITSGAIRASSSANLEFTSCNIFLDDVSDTSGNPNTTSLSYNADSTDRGDNGSYIRFIDTNIVYATSGSRRNIFVSELTRSNVINQDSGSDLFVYTQPNAIIDTVILQGINTLEVVGQFGVALNMTVDDVTKSYLNWEAGRLDFFGLGVLNKPTGDAQADAWIGNGASDNHVWHWNNKTTFDNQRVYLTATNNRYYDGTTISWKFIDRDTQNVVQNVKVKVKDDFPGVSAGGSMADRAEYLTNSSGIIAGTWDSQNRTTVSTGDRFTHFMVRNAITRISTGSPGSYTYPTSVITGDQGDRSANYAIDTVLNQIEIKGYLHEAPTGHIDGDTFDSSVEIGSLESDGVSGLTVALYSNFIMVPDEGISETIISNVEAYTGLNNLDKVYDRIKAEWYNNNNYPLAISNGNQFNLGTTDLIIDGTTGGTYTYNSGSDEITISSKGTLTISRVGATESVGVGLVDEITINFPAGILDNDVAYLAVGNAQSEVNSWNTPSGWVIPTGLGEVQTPGSSSVPGLSIFRRVLSSDSGSVTITNAGTNTSGVVAQMIVYRNVDILNPEDVLSTTANGSTGDPNPPSITTVSDNSKIVTFGFMEDGDQTTPTPPSGYSAILDTATLFG